MKGIDDLDVERHYGDIFDDEALRTAMAGCDDVFYCVVDTRAWLRDPAPLFRTTVEGLRRVLDTAVSANLRKFVLASTIGTIALSDDGPVSEDKPFNWLDRCGAYIRSRVEAKNLVLHYANQRGLPTVAMCVSNTCLMVRLMHIMSPMDHGKASRELGWQPEPIHDSVRKAIAFYRERARKER